MTDTKTQSSIRRRAPAKVNLTLAVKGKRADGFHDIESWVAPIALFDDVAVQPADRLRIEIDGDRTGVPTDGTNLAARAAVALAKAMGRSPDVCIRITKRIAPGAGLGGGSSDAAATLLALRDLWSLDSSSEQLESIAAELGSDVPFFLRGRQAMMRGRGERIERVDPPWRGWLVLVVPPFGCSTAEVYRAWSGCSQGSAARDRRIADFTAPAGTLALQLFNDLEAPAFALRPRLATLHAVLNGLDGCPVRMTGSGSALFAMFDTRDAADAWRSQATMQVGESTRVIAAQTMDTP